LIAAIGYGDERGCEFITGLEQFYEEIAEGVEPLHACG
jgi:hypothetical protein